MTSGRSSSTTSTLNSSARKSVKKAKSKTYASVDSHKGIKNTLRAGTITNLLRLRAQAKVYKSARPVNEPPIPKITPGVASYPAKSGASFLDLSPEIRNKIYGHLLVSPNPIRLGEIDIYNPSSTVQRIRQKDTLQTNILATCHQIHNEAAPMLYGMNHFHPRSGKVFDMFLQQISHSVKLLRHIRIQTIPTKPRVVAGLRNFRHARVLQTLEFGKSVRNTFSPKQLADALEWMMVKVSAGRDESVLQVLKFAPAAENLGDVVEQAIEMAATEEYASEVKKFLEVKLANEECSSVNA